MLASVRPCPPDDGVRPFVRVDFPAEGTHAGITFVDVPLGVRVKRVVERDRAVACGLRRGDVVTHINGIAVHTHRRAVAIVNRATEARVDLIFTLRPRRRTRWALWIWTCPTTDV